MNDALNVVFFGSFPYPKGMAGTMRVQHAIDSIKAQPGVHVRVIVLRQSSRQNVLAGVHEGTGYETVMGDLLRFKMLLQTPVFHAKAKTALERAFRPDHRNVLYVYGPPAFDNLPALRHARCLGFKVVFDIVEDEDLAFGNLKSPWHRFNNLYTRHATRRIASFADGIVVISRHLEDKFSRLVQGECPVHLRPVSVDLSRFPEGRQSPGRGGTLFYSGSFFPKDGVPVLLDAFDRIAAQHSQARLVLTGKGAEEKIREVRARAQASPFPDRIDYRGYLGLEAYYDALNAADIPCMTRIDTGYARAGFPFKLGEYLASGKPVIASRISDIPRMLTDRRDALLVPPGDRAAIVDAADYLFRNPEDAAAIGRRGREKARALFDYRAQGTALLTFLDALGGTRAAEGTRAWRDPSRSIETR